MTKSVRILVGSTLLLLLLAAGGLWFAADRLLDGVVRPWLTAKVAAELAAEVGLERLTYSDGRLRLAGLVVDRPGELKLEVAGLDVQFSWSGLLQRRIDELVIREPHLVWTAPVQETVDEHAAWPQDAPLQINAWRLENGRVELAWDERKFLFDELSAEGGLGSKFPFAMAAKFGKAPATPVRLAGSVRWEDGLALTLDDLSWDEKNLLVQPVSIAPGPDLAFGATLGLAQLDDLEVGGLLTTLGEPVPWPEDLHWQLTAPVLDLRLRGGRFEVNLQTGPGFLLSAGRRWPWLSMGLGLQGDPERLDVAGNVSMAGSTTLTLSGLWAEQQFNGSWSVAAAIPSALLQSFGMTMPASALTPGDLKMQGLIEAGHDSARLSKAGLTANLGKLGTLAGVVRGEWQGERLMLACDHLSFAPRDGSAPVAEAKLALAGTTAGSAWQGDWSLQVADVARLADISGFPLPDGQPSLQALTLNGQLRFQNGRLSLPGVNLKGKLTGAGLSGLLHGQLAMQSAPGGDLSVMLETVTLDALDYQAEDGMAGLVGGKLVLSGRLEWAAERLGFALSGRATADEALLDSWYGSLEGLPVSFAVKGGWLPGRQRLELTASDVDLASLLSGRFTGVFTDRESSLRGEVEIPKLQGAFQQTAQVLAGELLPGFDRISLGGGLKLDGAAQLREESWDLDLYIVPTAMTIAWEQETRVDGLHGRLPVHLRHSGPAADEGAETASLEWSRLQGGLFNSGPGRLELLASANRWRLQQPLEMAVAGGKLTLAALQLDLANLVPKMRASFEVKDVDLLQIAKSLEWPAMGGLLNARLEEVRIAGDEISTVGDASIDVFGGTFAVNNMRVEAPFSRFPTYHADVDFNGIDLYQLTNTFALGEMNGIADGYVHALRLFDGTPSAFHAKLETLSEGTRNISVKAIRNLNTLSMGGLSAALSQGIYQFIDFYHYRKIGILCSLQNDIFHLEGTARADSNRYLIYGGLLPPRIDVIVSSPTIPFREMVSRLKRIERADH